MLLPLENFVGALVKDENIHNGSLIKQDNLWEKNPHLGIQPNAIWRGLNACVSKVHILKSKSQMMAPFAAGKTVEGVGR